MKKVLISFGDDKFKKSLDLLEETANSIGNIDKAIIYDQEWLKTTEFWEKNKFILQQPRGAGYWLWKPYIILVTMQNLDYGDIVMYVDGGMKVIKDLSPLFDITEKKDRMMFKLPAVGVPHHKSKDWTKRDCFILTNSDNKKFWDADMVCGAPNLWKKTVDNMFFLNEWMRYMKDPRVVTDCQNILGINHLSFKQHRHDQSVLSIIATRENWEKFRDPTQWGENEINEFDNSPYDTLIYNHRNFKH